MKELKIIRQNYNDIKFIFDFFDRFAMKLKKVSKKEKTDETMVFLDHYNEEIYFVPAKHVNKILDYCYGEYFFKIVLSGSSYYQQVKKICDELEVENPIFDLFFRSFFLAIKNRYNCEEYYDYNHTKDLVYRIVLRSYYDVFDELPLANMETFVIKSKIILEKLEEKGLVSFYQNDITGNIRLRSYFPISCDTFKFKITSERDGFDKSVPMFDFLDLRLFLDNSESSRFDFNLLDRMDRAVQTLIVTSFIDAKFYNNAYTDNSYIKKLRSDKKRLEEKKKNA